MILLNDKCYRCAIETRGHTTVKLGGGMEFLTNIVSRKVDLVFNIAEGLGTYRSREAQVLPSWKCWTSLIRVPIPSASQSAWTSTR